MYVRQTFQSRSEWTHVTKVKSTTSENCLETISMQYASSKLSITNWKIADLCVRWVRPLVQQLQSAVRQSKQYIVTGSSACWSQKRTPRLNVRLRWVDSSTTLWQAVFTCAPISHTCSFCHGKLPVFWKGHEVTRISTFWSEVITFPHKLSIYITSHNIIYILLYNVILYYFRLLEKEQPAQSQQQTKRSVSI